VFCGVREWSLRRCGVSEVGVVVVFAFGLWLNCEASSSRLGLRSSEENSEEEGMDLKSMPVCHGVYAGMSRPFSGSARL
jgi:hypothetical protein